MSADLAAAAYAEHGRNLAYIHAETARIEERWLELHTALEAAVPPRTN